MMHRLRCLWDSKFRQGPRAVSSVVNRRWHRTKAPTFSRLRSGSAATRLRKGTLQCPLLPRIRAYSEDVHAWPQALAASADSQSRLKIRIARPGVNTQQFRYIDHNAGRALSAGFSPWPGSCRSTPWVMPSAMSGSRPMRSPERPRGLSRMLSHRGDARAVGTAGVRRSDDFRLYGRPGKPAGFHNHALDTTPPLQE